MLFKIYKFSFSAVRWLTFLRKQGWIIWLTRHAFDCDHLKTNGHMENTVWKSTLESIMHGTWKAFENYSVSLLMAK